MASLFSLEDLSPYHLSRQLLIYEHPAHDGDGLTECLAALVMKRDLGFLLALPRGILDDAEVTQGLVAPMDAMLGPTHPAEVPSMVMSGPGLVTGDGRPVQVTFADLSVDALGRLSAYDPEGPPELLVAFDVGAPDLVPEPSALLTAAQTWTSDPDMAASERVTFYSADEALPRQPRQKQRGPDLFCTPPPRAATGNSEPGPGQPAHEKPKRPTMAGLAAQLETLCATLPAISSKLAEVDLKQQELTSMVSAGGAAPLKQPLSGASALGAGSKAAGPLTLAIGPPPATRPMLTGPPGRAAEETADLEDALAETATGDPLARAMLAQSQALTTLVQQLAAAGGWFTRARRVWCAGGEGLGPASPTSGGPRPGRRHVLSTGVCQHDPQNDALAATRSRPCRDAGPRNFPEPVLGTIRRMVCLPRPRPAGLPSGADLRCPAKRAGRLGKRPSGALSCVLRASGNGRRANGSGLSDDLLGRPPPRRCSWRERALQLGAEPSPRWLRSGGCR